MQQNIKINMAIQLLETFFSGKLPFDGVMAKFFKNHRWMGARERREVAEFVYDIFRNFEKLRYLANKFSDADWNARIFVILYLKIQNFKNLDELRRIFSGTQSELSYLTETEINFLSSIDTRESLPINAQLNYPLWMEDFLIRAFGSFENLQKEMKAMNCRADVDLRVNTLKASKKDVIEKLNRSGLIVENLKFSENGLRILEERISRSHEVISNGLAEIQDEGSQLIAQVCGVNSKSTVVDFCAGAGGKTLAIAAAMENKGRIFAMDKYPERLERAKQRLRKAGVSNTFCQEITGKWLKRHEEIADVVLVDVPCSGTGTWRRNPDMRVKFSKNDLMELVKVQAEILEQAQRLVKKGGQLVYATCSVLMEENEDQVAEFLKKFPNFLRKKIELKNLDSIVYSGEFLKLSPAEFGTDGFFAALMERIN